MLFSKANSFIYNAMQIIITSKSFKQFLLRSILFQSSDFIFVSMYILSVLVTLNRYFNNDIGVSNISFTSLIFII